MPRQSRNEPGRASASATWIDVSALKVIQTRSHANVRARPDSHDLPAETNAGTNAGTNVGTNFRRRKFVPTFVPTPASALEDPDVQQPKMSLGRLLRWTPLVILSVLLSELAGHAGFPAAYLLGPMLCAVGLGLTGIELRLSRPVLSFS